MEAGELWARPAHGRPTPAHGMGSPMGRETRAVRLQAFPGPQAGGSETWPLTAIIWGFKHLGLRAPPPRPGIRGTGLGQDRPPAALHLHLHWTPSPSVYKAEPGPGWKVPASGALSSVM